MSIIYLYANNKDFHVARELAMKVIDKDKDTLRFRNPEHFGQSNEVARADKILLYGKYENVLAACQKHNTKLVHLTYDGKQIEASPEAKIPSMDWTKDELSAYADATGVEINSGDTKADILEKIDEANDS